MRSFIHSGKVLCLALALTGASGFAYPVLADDPLGESTGSDPTNFPDPVLNKNLVLPASLATAGTADASPTLSASPAPPRPTQGAGCTPLNPCAMPTPALDGLSPVSANENRPMQALRKKAKPIHAA